MAATKYGKYFIKNPVIKGDFVKWRIVCEGSKTGFEGMQNYRLRWNCVTKPTVMEKAHVHDFDEIFHFFGADASDITDFGAEIELYLGKEGEKHIIKAPTMVYVPKGMIHCPLDFKKVEKPVIFMNIALTPEYKKTVLSE